MIILRGSLAVIPAIIRISSYGVSAEFIRDFFMESTGTLWNHKKDVLCKKELVLTARIDDEEWLKIENNNIVTRSIEKVIIYRWEKVQKSILSYSFDHQW